MTDTHNMFGQLGSEEEDEGPPGRTDSESADSEEDPGANMSGSDESEAEEEVIVSPEVRKSRWSRRRSVNWKNRTETHSCDSDSGCGSVVAGVRSLVEETTDTANGIDEEKPEYWE